MKPLRGECFKSTARILFRASRVINQLAAATEWGDLDYLIIDFPPGNRSLSFFTFPYILGISTIYRQARGTFLSLFVNQFTYPER